MLFHLILTKTTTPVGLGRLFTLVFYLRSVKSMTQNSEITKHYNSSCCLQTRTRYIIIYPVVEAINDYFTPLSINTEHINDLNVILDHVKELDWTVPPGFFRSSYFQFKSVVSLIYTFSDTQGNICPEWQNNLVHQYANEVSGKKSPDKQQRLVLKFNTFCCHVNVFDEF